LNKDLLIPELSMFITKSGMSPDGVMRWSAVNSDIDWDLYGERMSLELYQKMIGYIKTNTPPPAQFKSAVCSDYWCGGLPYLSIAHYGDGNGKAVPGEVMELFVDGGRLKAKGIYFPNDLGKAVYKSVEEDEYINPQDEDKIRISIGFLDLAHKHGDGGNTFHRKSLTSVCPDCIKGVGDKIYLDGYLVHLALTRVPVNPRTEMKVDKSMTKPKTKKQDALSVVKNEALVDEIVTENGVEEKSVLVEMSDAETGNTDTVTDASKLEVAVTIDVPALVEESKYSKESAKEDKMDEEEMSDDEKEKHKKEMHKSLTAEDVATIVRSVLAEKDDTIEVVDGAHAPVTQKSVLDVSVEELYTSINSAVEDKSLSLEAKLQVIQPSLEKLSQDIITTVKSSVGQTADTVSNDGGRLLQAIQELSQKFDTGIAEVRNEVAILKEKSLNVPNIEQPRVPSPRSVSPQLVSQALQAKAQTAPKPGSVADIARRSVGLQS
jgi:hypothetical protein